MDKPIIGITMGDPAGIGPEIAAKALSNRDIYELCRPLVIGDKRAMEDGIRIARKPLKVNVIKGVSEAKYDYGIIDLIDLNNIDMNKLQYGTIGEMTGKAVGEYIKKAVELAMEKKIDAIVTNPIHKESFKLGGWGKKYAGHTEMLAGLTNTTKYSMMLMHKDLRVVHVTTHIPLRDVCNSIKKEKILDTIKIAYNGCKDLGIENPKIGVAGFNPHASDGGIMGCEEEKEIIPAIEEAKKLGFIVEGPIPPDTVFSKAKGGIYDIVVAMYHDQGHIPLKLCGFVMDEKTKTWDTVSGINATLGLPIIRTSVDHGTAFGKAGKGTANADSLIDAIHVAVKFAKNKKKVIK